MQTIAQKHIQVQKDMYACFIDYSKAFDRVHHIKLIECLEKIGIDGKDIRMIGNLYWQQKAAISIGKDLSSYTEIHRGVRQGCVLSPYLFNVYTEFIFRETQDLEGIIIGGRNINNLRYADDTVLLANTKENLDNLANKVKTNSSNAGLDMNAKKTKSMVIAKSVGGTADLSINGEEIEQVKQFKYLGAIITEDGRNKTEVDTRVGIAKTKFSALSKLLTSRQVSLPFRHRMLQCYVFSVFLYGAETWTLGKDLCRKVESFEMWCLRRMGKISRLTNEQVCKLLRTAPSLLEKLKSKKLQYFGHIKRHNSLQKEILEGKLEGTRSVGRQRLLWTDNIKEWTGRTLTNCTRAAKNRKEWKIITRRPQGPSRQR